MLDTQDHWYVRLPDGRVMRAANVTVLRRQLESGRLPAGSRVRREGEDAWRAPERVAELTPRAETNGHASATIASRLDPHQMNLAGVRSQLDEQLGALDSTFVSRKLLAAALAGLMLGGLAALASFDLFSFSLRSPGLGWLLPVAAVFVWSWLAVVLSKMTFAELSSLRPATWGDGLRGSFGATVHTAFAHGIILLLFGGIVGGLRVLPGWLATLGTEETATYFALASQVSTVAGTVAEWLVWPVFVLLLPLAAIICVEQTTFGGGLKQWLAFVWWKGRRVLMAELFALAIALLLTAPLALIGAGIVSRFDEPTALSVVLTRLTAGLTSSLLLAYLVVANVFAYLSEK